MRIIVIFYMFVFLWSCTSESSDSTLTGEIKVVTWNYADSLKKAIPLPEIPNQRFFSSEFGINTGNADNTENFNEAIQQVASKGGGILVVSGGTYQTGPIHLKSNVHLAFEDGVTLKFLPVPEKYPPVYTWFYGLPCLNYSPMIYAHNETNIRISGNATIDGQGNAAPWSNMKYFEDIDWDILWEYDDEHVDPEHRIFGPGHNLRPDLIGIVGCKGVHIQGLTITNAPLNPLHLVLSSDVVIEDISIKSKGFDQIGIVPECSQNMWIRNIEIEDCVEGIMIKAGQGKNQQVQLSKDIIIENVMVKNVVYNGVGIGTEIKGGVKNVFASKIHVKDARRAFAIKTDTDKKGPVSNVFVDSLRAKNIYDEVIYCYVFHGDDDGETADIRDLEFSNVQADSCGKAFFIEGAMRKRIQNVSIRNASFNTFQSSYVEDLLNFNLIRVKINGKEYNNVFDIGEIGDVNFFDEEDDEMETLDKDDIALSELPRKITDLVNAGFEGIPVDDIDRMITKTGVFYEIEFESEDHLNTSMIISDKGEIVRQEVDISFDMLPQNVIDVLHSSLNINIIPHIFKSINQVDVKGFRYYKVEGETHSKLFMLQISDEGEVLEEKTKVITQVFPTTGEFEE